MTDLIGVVLLVVEALDRSGIPYTIGGSLASSFSGEPRASIDADILVAMRVEQLDRFVALLGPDFYADRDSLARAIDRQSSTNLVHHPSATKVDLFIAGSLLDAQQLRRRRLVQVTSSPDHAVYVHSPEDILLQKLYWYRRGGEVSERQWRDVLGIILVQGSRLDREYLTSLASQTGLGDVLARAFAEAGQRP